MLLDPSSRYYRGFTLVELAIAMIVVGLLISGFLKGIELVRNARVTATISSVREIQTATNTFRDIYRALPGDFRSAAGAIQGCNAANFCGNGDGNGYVGDVTQFAGVEALNQAGTLSQPFVETSYFWKHLLLADLISSIRPNVSPLAPAWKATHPAAPVGGGFVVFHSLVASDWTRGIVLRLQNSVFSASGAVSPRTAEIIDNKMDDGNPDRGRVAADFGGTGCDPAGVYSQSTEPVCIMYFGID
jgi:prepilin-type N-terminal cleavage/methylation domain-containing protein